MAGNLPTFSSHYASTLGIEQPSKRSDTSAMVKDRHLNYSSLYNA